MLPEDPSKRRIAIVVWAIMAIAGSVAVWWLSTYLESLTTLAQTDRVEALELFRTRVMPALLLVVAVAVGSGALVLRQGLQMVREGSPQGRRAGAILAGIGFIVAAVPLVFIILVFYLLRRAPVA